MLAFDAVVNDKYLTRLERGRASPSFATLLRIVRALRVSLAEFVEIYERHLTEIDPSAGRDVPACPSAEALEYRRQENERDRVRLLAASAKGRMKPWT